GAAFTARHLHSVNIGLMNSRKCADDLRNLGGRYVFALPAEGIADAVDKIEIAFGVAAHEIAGAKPNIALGKHIAQDFGLVVGRVGVAFESTCWLRRVAENPADRLADFSRRGLLASSA